MAKVSVGLRGWRFEESEIFDDDGEFRPLEEIPEEPRERLLRLTKLVEEPCDACYLDHGEAAVENANQATIVYGEPLGEVLLCEAHEPDFLYWYREAGGSRHRGEESFADAFHEWYAGDNRAPDGYGGLDHVDADPANLPEPPGQLEIQRRVEEEFEGRRIDLREYGPDEPDEAEKLTEEDLEDADLDLSTDYPSDR